MRPNVIGGSLDGNNMPLSNKAYFMLTRYDDENNATMEVYWWNNSRESWVFQPKATAASVCGFSEDKAQ